MPKKLVYGLVFRYSFQQENSSDKKDGQKHDGKSWTFRNLVNDAIDTHSNHDSNFFRNIVKTEKGSRVFRFRQ